MNDEAIIRLYFDRDERAIAETQTAYGTALTGLARRMVNEQDAQECVNDTYLAAWNKIPPARPVHLFAWLAKVCRNLVCDRIDYLGAQKRSAQMISISEELSELIADPAADYEGDAQVLGDLISAFLKKQKKDSRILFLRRYWFGLSIRELAEESGFSESKIKTTLYRMRAGLKEELLKEGIAL